jgi:hypothetical protein
MMWSKIKSNVENKFDTKLKGRIQIYITSYGYQYDVKDLYNRGWITVDGKEVVSFSTPDAFFMNRSDYHNTTPTNCAQAKEINFDRTLGKLSENGEFSKFDLSHCCYAFLDMNIDEAINHKSPIIKSLAILDKRLGKRRLLKLAEQELHPLEKFFLDLRLGAS